MSARKRKPAAIYRKPKMVPATPENLRAWAQRMAEPDPLSRMLAEWSGTLRELLEREGVPVEQSVSPTEYKARMQRGLGVRSVDGGHVWYREADASPVALEAIDALSAIENIRCDKGDFRVLAAVAFGQALERLRATAAFGRAIHAYHASRAKPTVPDSQIRAALAKYPRLADAAAAVRLSERQLRTRRKRLKPEA